MKRYKSLLILGLFLVALVGALTWPSFTFADAGVELPVGSSASGATSFSDDGKTFSLKNLGLTAMCFTPNPAVYGITTGTMFCMRQLMNAAVALYSRNLANSGLVKGYQGGCYVIAIIFLGIRLSMLRVRHIDKAIISQLARIAVSIFIVTNTANLYNAFCSFMGDAIGWFASFLDIANPPTSCLLFHTMVQKTTNALFGATASEYSIWQRIDCLLYRLSGAMSVMPSASSIDSTVTSALDLSSVPATGNTTIDSTISSITGGVQIPTYVTASMVMILASALFSGTVGSMAAVAGLAMMVGLFKLIGKAMFMVLMPFFELAMLSVLAPLIAPLLVFKSDITKGIFDKWLNYIIATILSPVIMVAYIGFAIVTIDAFIEGETFNPSNYSTAGGKQIATDLSTIFSNCKPGELNNGTLTLCSFNQLFKNDTQKILEFAGLSAENSSAVFMSGSFSTISDPNPVLANWKMMGDAQAASSNCTIMDRNTVRIPQALVDGVNQLLSKSAMLVVPGPDKLKVDYIYFLQLTLTTIAMLILITVFYKLMEVIKSLVQSILSVGNATDGMSSVMSGVQQAFGAGTQGAAQVPNSPGLFGGGNPFAAAGSGIRKSGSAVAEFMRALASTRGR